MQNNSVLERSYINDFHRQNSMGAVKEVESMLLHPYSREQKVGANQLTAPEHSFKREQQLGKIQEKRIESWAKAAGFWISHTDETYEQTLGEKIAQGGEAVVYDNGNKVLKTIGLDYFILPIFALDRISLHNAYFEEREEYRF